jgi:hypothetical protein
MTNVLTAKDLLIPLPRPEYVALPEGFLSALAWNAFEIEGLEPPVSGKKLGLRFLFDKGVSTGKSVDFREMWPSEDSLEEICEKLEVNGLEETGNKKLLASAVLGSIKGTTTSKSKFVPASPLSPALAMLQNPVGLMGKANPPDLANILETIYALGALEKPTLGVTDRYVQACEVRLANDSILSAIDGAFEECVWKGKRLRKVSPVAVVGSEIRTLLQNSPFAWFHATWNKVTSAEWVLALPARVWVDWATCVLRTGFSMAYLWETSWYEALARSILADGGGATTLAESVARDMDAPLVWRNSDAPSEIRDLSSKLKWRCYKSSEIRAVLEVYIKSNSLQDAKFEEFISMARSDSDLRAKLQSALTPNKDQSSGSADNLWEAIRYSLKARERGDHYGFLESSGNRYLFAAPGIEWGALMASLTAERPGATTNLGEVARFVRLSGAQVHSGELLDLLERTGLARGSADADLAVLVETAYKEGKPDESIL